MDLQFKDVNKYPSFICATRHWIYCHVYLLYKQRSKTLFLHITKNNNKQIITIINILNI